MAYIRVDVSHTIKNGSNVSFKAPCDCNAVDGLKVYFPNDKGIATNQTFIFTDAHGNNLTGIGHLFKTGAVVKAILNLDDGKAYLQNADTNAYLEEKFENLQLTDEAKEEIIAAAVAEMEAKPVAAVMDFDKWADGKFYVGLSDGTTEEGGVVFDDSKRPTSVTLCGKTLTIIYPAAESEDSGDDSGSTAETITFTVGGIEYTAESGMTWEAWIASDYYVEASFLTVDDSGLVVNGMSGVGFNPAVNGTDTITSGGAYVYEDMGSDMG